MIERVRPRGEARDPLAEAPGVLTAAHVIHSLGAGGAESVLVELARVARAAGIRLIVIGLSDANTGSEGDRRAIAQLQELGATVYQLHTKRYDLRSALTLAKILRRERVDIVHTHLKHADVVGGVAARLAGVPSVSTLHVIDIPTSFAHRLRVRTAVLARRRLSTAVIAVSNAQLRWYRSYAGRDGYAMVLPNGVVEPEVNTTRAALRAELDVPEEFLLVSCISLMRPEKGHADLVEAIRQLPDGLPLVVAMAGDGPLLDSIRSAVGADPVLRARTRVLGFRRDVADLLAASDFVVHPSLEDALPTALISALAASRPIVATNVGGIPDIVAADCGHLVEPGNPAALSAGIAKMAATVQSDSAALSGMHRAARARYDAQFSAVAWADRLRALYQRVIDRGQVAALPGDDATAADPVRPVGRRIALIEFPPAGGLYHFSLQLGEALARAGDDVELITGLRPELPSREPRCRVRGILPTWRPTAGADVPDALRRARRGIRAVRLVLAWIVLISRLLQTRPDAVLWSEWRFPIDGWGVHLVRKALPNAELALVAHEPRVLVEQPGQDGMYKSSSMTNRALATAYADLDVVYVLGEATKRILEEMWPINGVVHVVPHGDESLFATTALPGAETTGPVALCFGTITAYKGIDTLLDAWPDVRARIPEAELVIAGALSPDVDKATLLSRVADIAGVQLHIGYVPVRDVPSYFAAARCVVLPYKRSSQSGVAHLSHTLSRPVVATRVGDIPAVVRDGVSGLLVDPSDSAALARALVTLLSDAELARRQGEAGARALAGEASWDHVATRVREGFCMSGSRDRKPF
ncbi:glycosyltransferase [Mycolicibacterium baixiangningiae]|uniref:glycosyltransferase n=1 Tax=Mycolicibacterium baixiangningiae TaxID=2761578 RepID=UPI0027DA2D5F|nr:glycosyltransferase [Mycolicibacterium baixiangningiae]